MTGQNPFLTAEWRHLAILNYEIDPAALAQRVPPGTELDSWDGRTLVSMVGFRFLGTRIRSLPVPFHRNFEEVNLRFYVRRRGPDGWRRGVVFVKEIVPRRAVAALARALYGENYVAMPMRHAIEPDCGPPQSGGGVEYAWRRGGVWESLRVRVSEGPFALAPGTEEEFTVEHYWGYALRRGGRALEYPVEHPPWRSWRVSGSRTEFDAKALYGAEFETSLRGSPRSAFLAEGSAVRVHAAVRL